MGLLSREHPKAQPGGWFLWVCYHGRTPEGSTGRLDFVVVFGEARDRTCGPWFTRRVT